MRLVTMICALVDANAPMPSTEKDDFRLDLQKEWDSIPYTDEQIKKDSSLKNKPNVKFKRLAENVWSRFLIIIIYMIATKEIRSYMNPRPNYTDPRFYQPDNQNNQEGGWKL